MLVLSRKRSECIDIAGGFSKGGVTVMVVSIDGDKVRLGIECDRAVPIHRREVQEAIKRDGDGRKDIGPDRLDALIDKVRRT